jgi:hypothetical protein
MNASMPWKERSKVRDRKTMNFTHDDVPFVRLKTQVFTGRRELISVVGKSNKTTAFGIVNRFA